MPIPDRPRITIDVTREQYLFLTQLPYGWKGQIFKGLINMLMDMTKRLGARSLGLIASESFDLEDYFDREKTD